MSDLEELKALGGGDATSNLVRTNTHAHVTQFVLRVIGGSRDQPPWKSDGEPVVLGTHPSATLRIDDRAVSRFHCRLAAAEDGRIRIRDTGSRNGTFVNGVQISEAWLGDSATIRIGRTEIEFSRGANVPLPISDESCFGEMVGRSSSMRRAFALLAAAGRTDMTVLLQGETGTGKDVAAWSIHEQGKRRGKPFVVLDCGAMPEHLMQAELFGHVRGAYTGANADRPGAFESASGGTIFLDEIGELPMQLQSNLLRVLESRRVRRIGDRIERPVDVRVIAATNVDLQRAVNDKTFRSDLYYRLAVLTIELPPLRDRPDDIGDLVSRIADELRLTPEQKNRVTSPEVIRQLEQHDWPGNVRELKNRIESMTVLAGLNMPAPARRRPEVPPISTEQPLLALRQAWVDHLESRYVMLLRRQSGGNISEMARIAGVSRMHIYRLLKKYDADHDE